MFDLATLEKGIIERLEPLKRALIDAGIPITCLPQEVGKYSEDVGSSQISIYIPSVRGITNNRNETIAQTVDIDLNIIMSLGKRYVSDPAEIDVLEWCCDQIIGLLLGFSPYDDIQTKRPIYFKSYELFKPDQNWEGQLKFGIEKQIRSIPFNPEDYEVMSVSLYNSLDLITGTKIMTIGED